MTAEEARGRAEKVTDSCTHTECAVEACRYCIADALRAATAEARNAALEGLDRLAGQWEQIAGDLDANAKEWRRRSTSEQPFVTQVVERMATANTYRACATYIRALAEKGKGDTDGT